MTPVRTYQEFVTSHTMLIYVNENSSVWDKIDERVYEERSTYRDAPTIRITDENKIVDILVKWWTKKYPMVEGQETTTALFSRQRSMTSV